MSTPSKTRICFILGIDQRSGTNLLFRLLGKHPNCVGPGPIWEDHFLQYSNILRKYTNTLYNSWNPRWEVEKTLGDQEVLLRRFGDAIEDFLRSQIRQDSANPTAAAQALTDQNRPNVLLSKTPNVEGIDNFFDFFPDAYLILLVRDGRAVVESGVRSFDWTYEDAISRWRNRAQIILNFIEKHESPHKQYIVVRYEDLIANKKESLREIFEFLSLDPEAFDFEDAESIGIIGSSDLRKRTGSIDWKEYEKSTEFNPLSRFEEWERRKHERFNWIAGQQMIEFGYELNEFNGNRLLYVIGNKLADKKAIASKLVKITARVLRSWSIKALHRIADLLSLRSIR